MLATGEPTSVRADLSSPLKAAPDDGSHGWKIGPRPMQDAQRVQAEARQSTCRSWAKCETEAKNKTHVPRQFSGANHPPIAPDHPPIGGSNSKSLSPHIG